MSPAELDRLVAEKVMGWEVSFYENINTWEFITEDEILNHNEFQPSTDIESTWLVIDELYKKTQIRMFVSNNFYPLWEARCKKDNGDWIGHGFDEETAPLAICKAALNAIGLEVK